MSNTPRRLGALVASSALALSGLALVASPAEAVATDPRPVAIGATWLEGQLTGGLMHNDQYDFDDVGLTLDAGFGLAAIGGHGATVATIAEAVGPLLDDGYAQGDEYEFTEPYAFVQRGYYAAQTAKALVFAQASGQDTETWAGFDLVAALEDRVSDAPSAGRIVSDSSYGDYTNTVGQAYAARGLSEAGSPDAAAVTAYLLDQQCAAGFFRIELTDQTCDADTGEADPDATAYAVQQLAAIDVPSEDVTAALAAAVAWLADQQGADGSFTGGSGATAANANSTGLIGGVLGSVGESAVATDAAVWLRSRQADELSGCPSALSEETGAVGYDAATLAAGRADGITVAQQDKWRRTTAPALAALAYAPAATPSLELTGPTTAKGGTVVVYGISGVVPGDKVCVSGLGLLKRVTAGADGTAKVAFTMPTGTWTRTITVRDRAGTNVGIQTLVLGPKTLTVVVPSNAKRGASVPVTVSGLYPGESVRITLDGVKIRTGFANTKGVFSSTFRAPTALGKHVVRAYGKYADIRKGYDLLNVVA